MKNIQWTYGCGCGKTASTPYEKTEWFYLEQFMQDDNSYNPKLVRLTDNSLPGVYI